MADTLPLPTITSFSIPAFDDGPRRAPPALLQRAPATAAAAASPARAQATLRRRAAAMSPLAGQLTLCRAERTSALSALPLDLYEIVVRMVDGRQIIVTGGLNAGGSARANIQRIDLATERTDYFSCIQLPSGPRVDHALVPIENHSNWAVIGGNDGGTARHGASTYVMPCNSVRFSDAVRFSPRNSLFSPLAPLAVPRWGHAAATLRLPGDCELVVVAGGFRNQAPSGVACGILADCEIFSTASPGGTRKWRRAASLLEGRTAAVSANVGNSLWVAGGQDRTMRTLDSIEWYDLVRDEWLRAETALPVGVSRGGACAHDGALYVAGGDSAELAAESEAALRQSFQFHDIRTKYFLELAPLPAGAPRANFSLLPLPGARALVTVGGVQQHDPHSAVRETYRYDTAADRWEQAPYALLDPVFSAAALVL